MWFQTEINRSREIFRFKSDRKKILKERKRVEHYAHCELKVLYVLKYILKFPTNGVVFAAKSLFNIFLVQLHPITRIAKGN